MAITAEQARAALRPHLSDPDRAVLTPITTGRFNDSFFVDAAEGALVLRIAPPDETPVLFYERAMMRQEPQLHDLLRRRTSVPVAEIVAFDDSRSVLDRDFLLMRRLSGAPLSERRPADPQAVLRQVGRALADVHALRADRYGYLGAHRPMTPQATWLEAFAEMWRRLLDDIVATGAYDDATRTRLMRALDHHRAALDRDVPACLLHMDIWAQNLLADEAGHLTGIVDWDRALWGDPEIEFAVLEYCGISGPAFWAGYGGQPAQTPEARVRFGFYLLYEHQKYIVIQAGRHGDLASARAQARSSIQLAERMLRV